MASSDSGQKCCVSPAGLQLQANRRAGVLSCPKHILGAGAEGLVVKLPPALGDAFCL